MKENKKKGDSGTIRDDALRPEDARGKISLSIVSFSASLLLVFAAVFTWLTVRYYGFPDGYLSHQERMLRPFMYLSSALYSLCAAVLAAAGFRFLRGAASWRWLILPLVLALLCAVAVNLILPPFFPEDIG